MKDKLTWADLMEAHTDRRYQMRAPALVSIVITLHVLDVGAFVFIQGCGTTRTAVVEPPPAPTLPPPDTAGVPEPMLPPPTKVGPVTDRAELEGGKTYVVQKGDSLSVIARKNGVSVSELISLNKIADKNQIRIGQKLLLPPYAKSSGSSTVSKPRASASGATYNVQSGDTLSGIAVRNGTTVRAIKDANGLSSDMIRIGQELVIPGGSAAPKSRTLATNPEPASAQITPPPAPTSPPAASVAPVEEVFEYEVMDGDALSEIAKNFAVLEEDVIKLNGLVPGAELKAGQKIKIPPMAY